MRCGMAGLIAKCTFVIVLVIQALPALADTSTKGRVFLTFDDGPIDITLDILDVLKAQDVKATFFINAVHLAGQGGEHEGSAQVALRRLVAEGHVIGNHSDNHMAHNRPPGVYSITVAQAYHDMEVDLQHFVPDDIAPVNEALGELATFPNNQISRIARLPFSNVWMLPGLDKICHWCDIEGGPFWYPEARAKRVMSEVGGQVAAALYSRYKMNTFGWDVDWKPTAWTLPNTNETLAPAATIEREIVSLLVGDRYCSQTPPEICKSPVKKNNVIVLTHDFLFENGVHGHGKDVNLPQLAELIKSLKAKDFVFDTLDHYLD